MDAAVALKKCNTCNRLLPNSSFYKRTRSTDGLTFVCKDCSKTRWAKWRKENKRTSPRKKRGRPPKKEKGPKKRYQVELRFSVLRHLAKNEEPKCNACSFSDIRVLQIDHINNDGAQERKKYGGNMWKYYKTILNTPIEEALKKYQILCPNCNRIKEFERRAPKLSYTQLKAVLWSYNYGGNLWSTND